MLYILTLIASTLATQPSLDSTITRSRLEMLEAQQNLSLWRGCHPESQDYGQWLRSQLPACRR